MPLYVIRVNNFPTGPAASHTLFNSIAYSHNYDNGSSSKLGCPLVIDDCDFMYNKNTVCIK